MAQHETAGTTCTAVDSSSNLLPRRKVLYCGACGMPLEYCEYGPDFESACSPWLLKHHPDLYQQLEWGKIVKKGGTAAAGATAADGNKVAKTKAPRVKPDRPWTTEERLVAFYEDYEPEKLEGIPALLEKYVGKEEKLFQALVKKYGPEPYDPFYADSDDDDDDDDEDDGDESDAEPGKGGEDGDDEVVVESTATGQGSKNKRRGVSAKKTTESDPAATRVLIQKVAKKKKRNLTIVIGMETVPGIKLKDLSKVFSKKFAGSSSVKKNALGQQEIIIQGDHLYDVAELIIDKFQVPETAVYLDIEGDIVPFK